MNNKEVMAIIVVLILLDILVNLGILIVIYKVWKESKLTNNGLIPFIRLVDDKNLKLARKLRK